MIARYGSAGAHFVQIDDPVSGVALRAATEATIGYLNGCVTKTEWLQSTAVWWAYMERAEWKMHEPRPVEVVRDQLERV